MLPWQPEFQSNQPKNHKQPSPYVMMLHIEFDRNWPTDLELYYFERRMTDAGTFAILIPHTSLSLK